MTFFVTFVVLAIVGIADAGYLVYEHRKHGGVLVCPMDHDCSVVTESKWSRTFGVRNETMGLAYYLMALAGILAAIALPAGAGSVLFYLLILSAGGLAYSFFLTGVQFFVIKDYCFYCLISAGLTLLLFLNSVYLYYGSI